MILLTFRLNLYHIFRHNETENEFEPKGYHCFNYKIVFIVVNK